MERPPQGGGALQGARKGDEAGLQPRRALPGHRREHEGNARMIGIADYGAGNLRSVQAALTRLRLGWKLVARPEDFAGLGGLILPGVGRFGAAARRLREAGANDRIVAALTNCPPEFVSALQAGSLWAVQFHPEKSGEMGSRLLAGFAALTGAPEARFQRDALDEGVGTGDGDGRARPHRIIPCLDIKGGRVVKGDRFRDLKDAGDPVERASAYDRDGADEVCFLDVSASREERRPLLDLVGRVAARLTVPFTVGGGVRSIEEMRALLLAGADRVSIGTAACVEPGLIGRAALTFGSQFVIVSIDARR